MDMEPWRESATPSISRYSEGGFIGWFSRSLKERDECDRGVNNADGHGAGAGL